MLLITPAAIKNKGMGNASQRLLAGPILARTPANSRVGKDLSNHKNPQLIDWAVFAHSIRTRPNTVKFGHQLLQNPKLSTLTKALRKGFLKGCPNLNETLVTKYLNLSPATAKGHMKQPKKGIRSTTLRPKQGPAPIQPPGMQLAPSIIPHLPNFQQYPDPAYNTTYGPNTIMDDESIANVFCFGAFADKVRGVIYNDLTDNFPCMLLDGSMCFFVMYHYKTNAILATPIANLDDKRMFEAYKTNFEMLDAKGYKPQVKVMDNQATKFIK